ncbi:MAG: 16S rRNA (guanine(966)-N(2))-methyltransferase RsmD [Desulfobulbus propionicus]|nr:MAG: 16S rRNA (guanine(966)-N(2))-methyltransferase RsmD [Desulfobulbus propionicus]
MRITGGSKRGRRLAAPKKNSFIRPTSDRVREALFTLLADRVSGSMVLDIFAGTGSLGIEALSRGAEAAVFIDHSKEAARLVQTNLLTCFTQPRALFFFLELPGATPLTRLAARLPQNTFFDLVFLDPPYRKKMALPVLEQLRATKILASDCLIIVEEHQHAQLPDKVADIELVDHRIYGETGLWFYAPFSQPGKNTSK